MDIHPVTYISIFCILQSIHIAPLHIYNVAATDHLFDPSYTYMYINVMHNYDTTSRHEFPRKASPVPRNEGLADIPH